MQDWSPTFSRVQERVSTIRKNRLHAAQGRFPLRCFHGCADAHLPFTKTIYKLRRHGSQCFYGCRNAPLPFVKPFTGCVGAIPSVLIHKPAAMIRDFLSTGSRNSNEQPAAGEKKFTTFHFKIQQKTMILETFILWNVAENAISGRISSGFLQNFPIECDNYEKAPPCFRFWINKGGLFHTGKGTGSYS